MFLNRYVYNSTLAKVFQSKNQKGQISYSTVSIESTILILEMDLKGTAVASRQAAIAIAAASSTGIKGKAVSCMVSVEAAFTKIVQI